MFRDAEISPPTFTVLSNFKSSHKNARDFLPPGSPFLCFFCCSGFSDWFLFSINIHFTFNVLEQLGCFFVVVVFFFFSSFSFLPSLCILLLAQRLPLLAFFSSCSGLPNRLLASFPPYLFAPSSPLPAQCQHHAPSSRIPLLLAPSPHLLPTCQAGSTPQFHQVAWGWGWACCHLNSLHPRQPEMESVINGTVPGSISSGNFKLMMFK